MERPTFAFCGNPVRAAGLLVCTKVNGEDWTLLRRSKKKWSDIGGKTEPGDKNIADTIVREVCEETNHALFSENDSFETCDKKLRGILKDNLEVKYDKKCKYLIVKCYVPKSLMNLPTERFGEAEKETHHYEWFRTFPKCTELHYRLRACLLDPRWHEMSLDMRL